MSKQQPEIGKKKELKGVRIICIGDCSNCGLFSRQKNPTNCNLINTRLKAEGT